MAFPVVQSTNTATGLSGGVTVASLASLAVGDLMVAAVGVTSNTPTGISPPSGWTQVHSYAPGNTSMCIFTKTAVAGDVGATFGFSWSIGGSNQDAGAASVSRITGIDGTTPILSSTYNDNSGSSLSGTAINPSKNVLFLQLIPYVINSSQISSVSGYAVANNNPSWTELADTSRVTATNSATAGVAVASARQGTVGTTGVASATLNVASTSYSFAFLGIQSPNIVVTPLAVSTSLGSTIFVRKVTAIALAVVSIIGTPVVTVAGIWVRQAKNVSAWVNQSKS